VKGPASIRARLRLGTLGAATGLLLVALGPAAPLAEEAIGPGAATDTYAADVRRCPRPADSLGNHMDCRLDWFDAALETITEFWAEARSDMMQIGVVPRASLYGNFFVSAGMPGGGTLWGATASLSVTLDMARLAGARGLSFYVAGLGALSETPWPYPVSVNYVKSGVWLTELYVQQKLLEGRLTLAAGRLQPAMSFAFLPVMLNYLSNLVYTGWLAFDEPPYPPQYRSQWGAQAAWTVDPEWQVEAGVFNNNPYAAAGAAHGFDWRLQEGNVGVLVMAQGAWMPGARKGSGTLPGMYGVGGWYDGNRFVDLGTGATSTGSYGFYAMAQQMVLRHGEAGSGRGLTVWALFTWTPRVDVNLTPIGLEGGASWHGFADCRPRDTVSLAAYAGRYSPALPGDHRILGLEATYDLSLTRAISVIADVQGIFGVNGEPGVNAFVAGLQLGLTL
jgi:porin